MNYRFQQIIIEIMTGIVSREQTMKRKTKIIQRQRDWHALLIDLKIDRIQVVTTIRTTKVLSTVENL